MAKRPRIVDLAMGPTFEYQVIDGHRIQTNVPEPTSPSVGTGLSPQDRIALLEAELLRRNQDIEDLRLTNRNLSRKIVEDARKRGEAATQQPNWLRGIHGS